ncbi:MAG: helix-hairpin-helix domain-containing protein, partial [Microbacteriaceae bacterium]|nr:helix-hairpin-helix domain-containing protein [Microbacteriaceae bacterium]
NLARVLIDAEQVVVPVAGAVPAAGAGPPGVASDGRVDLNTADRAALETLPRVGPAMADRIIAWRTENGGFRSVDDLRQVSGIGDKTFDALVGLVTV